MTYGKQLAVMILTANDLNVPTGFVEEARQIINGKMIQSSMMLWFERAAMEAKEAVLAQGLGQQADALASAYAAM